MAYSRAGEKVELMASKSVGPRGAWSATMKEATWVALKVEAKVLR